MSLTFRFSDAEGAVRSTGDPPNGILSVGFRDGEEWTFYVSAVVDPSGPKGVRLSQGDPGLQENPLTVAEVYEAVGDDLQLGGTIYGMASDTFRAVVELALAHDQLPMLALALSWLSEVRDAMAALVERTQET